MSWQARGIAIRRNIERKEHAERVRSLEGRIRRLEDQVRALGADPCR